MRTRTLLMIAVLLTLLAGCLRPSSSLTPTQTAQPGMPTPVEATQTAPAPTMTPSEAPRGVFPADWRAAGENRWQEPGGALSGELAAWDGASLDALCQLEANRGRPERYGSTPEIRKVTAQGREGCLVVPSPDQPAAQNGAAAALIPLPPDQLIRLRGAAQRLEDALTALALPQPAPTPAAGQGAAACDFSVWDGQAALTRAGNMAFEEYRVAAGADCSPYLAAADFAERVQQGAAGETLARLEQARFSPARIAALNSQLRPFGYRLDVYDPRLVRIMDAAGNVARANLSWLGQLTLSGDGRSFLLPGLDAYDSVSLVLTPHGLITYDSANLLIYDRVFPVLAGDAEIKLQYDLQVVARPPGDPAVARVLRNGQVVDTLAVSGSSPAGGAVRGLWAEQGRWVAELPGVIVEDGTLLNDALGCSEMFAWQLIGGKPFFFCRAGGEISGWQGGAKLAVAYDEVLYAAQLGAKMLAQMRRYEDGLAFFARRDDTWLFVAAYRAE